MKHLAVIAFGGNAILRGDEAGTIQQQEQNTYDTCKNLLNLIENGYDIVITHGNGPQVGNILLRNEAGSIEFHIPKMPLDICVADSQGGIGYMIERQMRNLLVNHSIKKNVVTFVTEVLVDKNDSAFQNPTKPVGTYYTKEEADLLSKDNGWVFKEDARKRGWRRLVASPTPVDVMNKELIKELAEEGNVVIAAGGGGVPVYMNEDKTFSGIEAVIDKDLASALLAKEIGADTFYILTDIPKAYINFGKPEQKALDVITAAEAREYYNKGEFGSGSMGPKVLAAVNFVENGGKEAVITEASMLHDKTCGTRIIR